MTPFLSMPLPVVRPYRPKLGPKRAPLLRIKRTDWPYAALELLHRDGRGWFLLPLTTDLTTLPLVERDVSEDDQ